MVKEPADIMKQPPQMPMPIHSIQSLYKVDRVAICWQVYIILVNFCSIHMRTIRITLLLDSHFV